MTEEFAAKLRHWFVAMMILVALMLCALVVVDEVELARTERVIYPYSWTVYYAGVLSAFPIVFIPTLIWFVGDFAQTRSPDARWLAQALSVRVFFVVYCIAALATITLSTGYFSYLDCGTLPPGKFGFTSCIWEENELVVLIGQLGIAFLTITGFTKIALGILSKLEGRT